MEDSATPDPTTEQPAPANQPAPKRPKWRFSGKRGTPVHQRGTAASTPPEVRAVAEQLVRERTEAGVEQEQPRPKLDLSTARGQDAPNEQETEAPVAAASAAPDSETASETAPAASSAPDAAAEPVTEASDVVSGPVNATEQAAAQEPVAADEPAVEPAAEPEIAAVAAVDLPPAIGGLDSGRTAQELIGLPVVAFQPEAAEPVLDDASHEPEEAATTPERDHDAPAASSVERPRSSRRRTHGDAERTSQPVRRSRPPHVAWEPSTERPVSLRRSQPSGVPASIAQLDEPLRPPSREPGPILEHRVTRRRTIARRAELDAALADLQTVVESTSTRRRA